jgi:hypothetical protein
MELCTHWSGDGDVCPCAVFGMEPNTPDWVDEQPWCPFGCDPGTHRSYCPRGPLSAHPGAQPGEAQA